jgi:hypothetical protein
MDKDILDQYLGMAIHFVYYHHGSLHQDAVFKPGYCEQLMQSASREYWGQMHACLSYALTQNDYCLSFVNHPFKQRYSEDDIRLFFRKFHAFLGDCISSQK